MIGTCHITGIIFEDSCEKGKITSTSEDERHSSYKLHFKWNDPTVILMGCSMHQKEASRSTCFIWWKF